MDSEQIKVDMLPDTPPGAMILHAVNVLRMVITHQLGRAVAVSHDSPQTRLATPDAMRYQFDAIDAAMDDAAEWGALEFGHFSVHHPDATIAGARSKWTIQIDVISLKFWMGCRRSVGSETPQSNGKETGER